METEKHELFVELRKWVWPDRKRHIRHRLTGGPTGPQHPDGAQMGSWDQVSVVLAKPLKRELQVCPAQTGFWLMNRPRREERFSRQRGDIGR